VALYVRDLPKIAEFYAKYFGFVATFSEKKDKAILAQPKGGLRLVLLQASKGHRIGQSCVKIIFDVHDIARFKEEQARLGLKFGTIHRGPGYEFANARDPAKNLIQISNGFLVDENGT
jgi:predicted enzyme related to lactoylglutathione lyase